MNFDKLDRAVDWVMNKKDHPAGCAVAVSRYGETLYTRCAGYANEEKKTPVTEDTIFDIWSLTKGFVCTAAMTLFEEGAFLLNEPLSDFFPEYKDLKVYEIDNPTLLRIRPARTQMLVKDAFAMSCGLPYATNFGTDPEVHPTIGAMLRKKDELRQKLGRQFTLREEIEAMAEVPLAFDPGTHWMYGYGHELVAGLIEVCSGMRVDEFIKKRISEPLGLNSTGYSLEKGWEDRMATFYKTGEQNTRTPVEGGFIRHDPAQVYHGGGGGIISSLRDMNIFWSMLANNGIYRGRRIIGRKTIDLMRTNQLSPVQLEDFYTGANNRNYMAGYGYGLGVRTLIDKGKGYSNSSLGEFGWTGGSGTWAAADPEEGYSIVYLHQLMPNQEAVIHQRIRNAAYACLE